MKRFISRLSLIALAAVFVLSCKKDDDTSIAPPRDYAVQYLTEKADIEEYLKVHYIVSVSADYDIVFAEITDAGTQTSIWDQTTYPLQNKLVTYGTVEYTVYYLVLRGGVGDAPTRGDNVLAAYEGTLLNGDRFDYLPFPQNVSSLNDAILGWQEIIPLFKEGVYLSQNPQDPASFSDYGAGVMFLPSALAYYNRPTLTIPAYSPTIFSFKLYAVEDGDVDGDGLTNKQELGGFDDPAKFDSDSDGIANYLDTDDDNDGTLTRTEITDDDDEVLSPIPACTGGNGLPRHLDPSCDGF